MKRGKSEQWLTQEGLTRVQGWARDGLNDAQIYHNMGIGRNTYYVWLKKYPELKEATRQGKEVVDYAVENALLKRALSGDTTAAIFWLKSRRPDKWRDRWIVTDESSLEKLDELIKSIDSEAKKRGGKK